MLDDLRTTLSDRFDSFTDWLAALTVFEWVLLALAAGLVMWVVLKVRAATTLGPIDVEEVKSDSTNGSVPVLALTERLRERIDDVGFRPPSDVPAGAPQANLLKAISTSPIPQANWIATLLEAIPTPQPVSYKLATTVLTGSSGMGYWLQPTSDGEPMVGHVDGGVQAAIDRIAEKILMHVSQDAGDIFPPWTCWHDVPAVQAYLRGIKALKRRDDAAASAEFTLALARQPDNAVAKLRLLNAREAMATDAVAMAQVLRDYLDLTLQRPELVEARFRAATLAAMVASALGDTATPNKGAIVSALSLPRVTDESQAIARLRRVGRIGISQALRELSPAFAIIVWRRPRYAIEPQGRERRRLKRSLKISKHCQRARAGAT